jgi:S-(hydroxymethyl)glutathione dehydrogenase/alcohol dehydrogenase
MKAAILVKQNVPLVVAEVRIPELSVGQVLVKVEYSGICGKQLDEISGKQGADPYLPHLLGHEGAGVVEAIGPGVTQVVSGDHVVLSWIKGAGINASTPTYYKGEQPINAGWVTTFNEYAVVSENRLTSIRRDMPLDKAALLGCAVPTGLGVVINQARVAPGSTVAIFGVGGIGVNAIQGAVLVSASKIIAVDVHDRKLALAQEFGATHTINAAKEDPVQRIREITGGTGVDYAFEMIGRIETMEQAYESARNDGGYVDIAGVPPHGKRMSIDAFALHSGKRLVGAHGGDTQKERDFPKYIDLYFAGKLKLDELITHRFRLDEINDAFQAMERGELLRAIVEF